MPLLHGSQHRAAVQAACAPTNNGCVVRAYQATRQMPCTSCLQFLSNGDHAFLASSLQWLCGQVPDQLCPRCRRLWQNMRSCSHTCR